MKRWGIVVVFLLCSAFGFAQTQSKPEILILGTYHMANPGRDIYNMQADDVLSSKRQEEISQLLEVLKKFNPTKVAVESTAWSDRAPSQYADYLAGKYTLTRNEIDQVGYRLAKELGPQDGLSSRHRRRVPERPRNQLGKSKWPDGQVERDQ